MENNKEQDQNEFPNTGSSEKSENVEVGVQHDDDGNDGGEDRSVDEESRQHGWPPVRDRPVPLSPCSRGRGGGITPARKYVRLSSLTGGNVRLESLTYSKSQ